MDRTIVEKSFGWRGQVKQREDFPHKSLWKFGVVRQWMKYKSWERRGKRREADALVARGTCLLWLCAHRTRWRHDADLDPTSLQSPWYMAQASGKNRERVDNSVGWKKNIWKTLAATWGKSNRLLLPRLMTSLDTGAVKPRSQVAKPVHTRWCLMVRVFVKRT